MDTPSEQCWSFAYHHGGALRSFEIVAPSREIAESAAKTAICEGAIVPAPPFENPGEAETPPGKLRQRTKLKSQPSGQLTG